MCAIDTYCSNWNAWRHLYDAEHGIESVEHTFDGHSDDRQRCAGGNDSRQCGCHSCCGNYYPYATAFGSTRKRLHGIRSTVCREGVHLEGYLHLVKKLTCFLHYGQVACAAHDNANYWFHIVKLLILSVLRQRPQQILRLLRPTSAGEESCGLCPLCLQG